MYPKKEIIKTNKHGEREAIGLFPDYNAQEEVTKRGVPLDQGSNGVRLCPVSGGDNDLWCADDYKEERGGPEEEKESLQHPKGSPGAATRLPHQSQGSQPRARSERPTRL